MDYGFKTTFGNESDDLFRRTALQALIKSDTPIRETELAVKPETAEKVLTASQLSVDDTANFSSTSVDFVLSSKQNI